MINLEEYERLGDLNAPFQRTAKHERAQKERERLREALRCDVSSLTYDEYQAGVPCPGCGRPYRDEERWEFRGTMHMTEEQRARYEVEERRYKASHGSCGSHRHSVSGSLTMHCGKCCPPPPLSPVQIEQIGRILRSSTPPHMLMRWRLRLYCGHIVERTAHFTHKTLHAAFAGMITCSECGLDPAIIVDGAAIGLAAQPPTPHATQASRARSKPSRAQLEARIRELEAEVERLRPT